MEQPKPSQKHTRVDEVRRRLEREILAGAYDPGEHLDEVTQARRLGCSRTPLREAFNQLVAVGLLTRRPHCGVFVADDTAERARELIEAFAAVEAMCAALAAERMAPRQKSALARKAEGDAARFRRAVRLACGNRVLAEQAEGLERRVATYRRLEGARADDLDRLAARRVAEAVTAGDPDLARRAVRDRLAALSETAAAALPGRRLSAPWPALSLPPPAVGASRPRSSAPPPTAP